MNEIKNKFNTPKNKITIISILAFAVALCCILAFAGKNDEEIASSVIDGVSSEAYVSEVTDANGYGLYIEDFTC